MVTSPVLPLPNRATDSCEPMNDGVFVYRSSTCIVTSQSGRQRSKHDFLVDLSWAIEWILMPSRADRVQTVCTSVKTSSILTKYIVYCAIFYQVRKTLTSIFWFSFDQFIATCYWHHHRICNWKQMVLFFMYTWILQCNLTLPNRQLRCPTRGSTLPRG